MILHAVFCNFRSDVTVSTCEDILAELGTFALRLEGVVSFQGGPNRDFEGKSGEYSHGFIIRFQDRQALQKYADHPRHIELGGRLCDLCNGGADGIMVYDLETGSALDPM